ncbi:MAG: DoxX family protein, partial [Chthoniobacterales bacterium]
MTKKLKTLNPDFIEEKTSLENLSMRKAEEIVEIKPPFILDRDGTLRSLPLVSLREFFIASTPSLLHLAILIFRIALGLCFVVHGLGKLGVVGPGNMSGFISWLRSLSVPVPALQARLAMLSELIGGALIACGLLTRVAAFFCL